MKPFANYSERIYDLLDKGMKKKCSGFKGKKRTKLRQKRKEKKRKFRSQEKQSLRNSI